MSSYTANFEEKYQKALSFINEYCSSHNQENFKYEEVCKIAGEFTKDINLDKLNELIVDLMVREKKSEDELLILLMKISNENLFLIKMMMQYQFLLIGFHKYYYESYEYYRYEEILKIMDKHNLGSSDTSDSSKMDLETKIKLHHFENKSNAVELIKLKDIAEANKRDINLCEEVNVLLDTIIQVLQEKKESLYKKDVYFKDNQPEIDKRVIELKEILTSNNFFGGEYAEYVSILEKSEYFDEPKLISDFKEMNKEKKSSIVDRLKMQKKFDFIQEVDKGELYYKRIFWIEVLKYLV